MKKQTTMVLSLSALLAIGTIAPHVIWQANTDSKRAPASVEQKDLFSNPTNKLLIEKITKKNEAKVDEAPLKKIEVAKDHSLEVKKADIDAQVTCLKEKQPADLEAQIKKLVEDKEAVVKELAELKKSKKSDDLFEDKKIEVKQEKKIVKSDNTEDVLGIMSQLTSLMVSQQQQQMMMMTQMFSMFQNQQPKQQSQYNAFSPLSEYMSPYAFNANSFAMPSYDHSFNDSLYGMENQVGFNANYERVHSNFDRAPAQFDHQAYQSMLPNMSAFGNDGSIQPQNQTPRPHNGFNFQQGTNAIDMQRVEF
jgi:hypothetical protein